MNKQIYKYNISDIIETHFNKISKNKDIILHICIYSITHNNITTDTEYPFIQYLLYKNLDDMGEVLTFPFIKINTSDNVLVKSKEMYTKITKEKQNPLGFLQNDKNIYVFFEYQKDNNIEFLSKKDTWWWALIDEICNNKKVINCNVHNSVYKIFYSNPTLIYLLDENKKPYEIPSVGYYGTPSQLMNYVSTLGIKANVEREFGPFYYFNNFIGSTRRAAWTSNYKKMYIGNENIVNTDGRYKDGGYIRFAMFLGITKVILYRDNSDYHKFISILDKKASTTDSKSNNDKIIKLKNNWVENYDSLIISNIKYKKIDGYYNINKKIILKNFNQFTPLSTHFLNLKTLKNIWDPFYEKYNIL